MKIRSNLKPRLLSKIPHSYCFPWYKIYQVNIVATYLQGDLDEKILMKILKRVEKLGSGG